MRTTHLDSTTQNAVKGNLLLTHIFRRPDSSLGRFFSRTISAQLHLLGLIAAVIGCFALMHAVHRFSTLDFWVCLVFGLTSIAVFGVSTFYHFVHDGFQISHSLELNLEKADHIAIFLFIAGTYSPVLVNSLVSQWKWILLISVWSVCALGVVYTLAKNKMPAWAQMRGTYIVLFLFMGWLLLFRIGEMLKHLSESELWLLAGGVVAYSIGVAIYGFKRPNLIPKFFGYHELWHVMVIAGFTSHYFLILQMYRR